jgi:hypothetical protein
MPTNSDAVAQLEDAKKQFEGQTSSASGATLLQLLSTIQHIADEVGAIEATNLDASPYVPQTNPFKAATTDAQAFESTLNHLKTLFAAVAQVAQAADTVLGMIK